MSVNDDDRDLKTALLRGWRRQCPACGEAPLMQGGFLQVRDECSECGTELHHHRADDGPAWATIVVTGKLTVPVMLFVYEFWRPEAWMMALVLCTIFAGVSLWMLPRFKGVFVGLQWAKRMHGFAHAPALAWRGGRSQHS